MKGRPVVDLSEPTPPPAVEQETVEELKAALREWRERAECRNTENIILRDELIELRKSLEEKEPSGRNALNLGHVALIKIANETGFEDWLTKATKSFDEDKRWIRQMPILGMKIGWGAALHEKCLSSHAPESDTATRASIPKSSSSEGTNQ